MKSPLKRRFVTREMAALFFRVFAGIIFATGAGFLLSGNRLFATHIAGAEMYYECIGGNQYRITLKMYRDCANAQPGATFPDPATIFIFESQTKILSMSLNFPAPTFTPKIVPDNWTACTGQPYTLCIEEGIYSGIVSFPPKTGGYDIGFAVCCRNNIITNLQNPMCDGVTFLTHIPDPALASCNSMPVFDQRPSLFLCAGMTYNFDHSATDKDGDSLVYSISNPFTGLNFQGLGAGNPGGFPCTPGQPDPQVNGTNPMGPPNYMNVTFGTGYNFTNPFGQGSIAIDPQTGWLTAIPMNPGVYVFAISVSEYRKGALLSENKRDFQFHVISCTPQGAPPVITPDLTLLPHSNDTIFAYAARPFCFDFTVQDTGPFIKLIVTPVSAAFGGNGGFPLPYATISFTGTNPILGEFCWRPSCALAGQTIPIIISARDSSDCPNYNIAFDTIYVTVLPPVNSPPLMWHSLSPNVTNGDTILLQVKQNFCFDFFIVDTTGWGSIMYDDEIQNMAGQNLNEVHTINTSLSGDTLFGEFCWKSYCNIGSVYQVILHGIDEYKCPPMNESRDTIFIRVLSPDAFTPVIFKDLTGLSMSADTVLSLVHNEFCFDFTVIDTSGSADSIFIETLVLDMTGDTLGGSSPKITGQYSGDTLFGRICWKPSCEHAGKKVMLIVKGIQAAKCWVLMEASDTVFVNVSLQSKPPPVVTHDFQGLQMNGDTILFNDRNQICYGFAIRDTAPPTYLTYSAYGIYRDGSNYPGTQPSLSFGVKTDSLVTGTICWAIPCQYGGAEFSIVVTGKDTFDCNLQNTVTDTIYLRHIETVPDKVAVCNASVNPGDQSVDIHWNYNPGSDFAYIAIERRKISEMSFSVVDTVTQIQTNSVTDETNPLVDEFAYCYRLTAVDSCGNSGPVSDEVCTMVLSGEREEFNSDLEWTMPVLAGGPSTMDVFVSDIRDLNAFVLLASLAPAENAFLHQDVEFGIQCYRIRTFSNSAECTEAAWSNEICIAFPPRIFFPNAFTPNADGLNDILTFPHKFVKDFHFMIYDRWGKLIFETWNVEDGWNGMLRGSSEAPEGVYMYSLSGNGYDATSFERRGSITLIR